MDFEDPLISVVITTFNSEKFIPETINSVLGQTFQKFEIIIVDDQSSDSTPNIIKSYSANDPRISFYSIHHSGRPSSVRNFGIAQAKGKFIAFLDGDDLWEKHKLAEQVNSFKKNPGAVLVYSAAVTLGANILSDDYELLPLVYKAAKSGDELIRRGNSIPLSTVLVPKKNLDKAGGFDEDPQLKIEDFDLWLRLSKYGEFHFLPRVHAFYRIHSAQFSSDWETKRIRLDYLAEKNNLALRKYSFVRTRFIFRPLRGIFHYINYMLIKLITFFGRAFNLN